MISQILEMSTSWSILIAMTVRGAYVKGRETETSSRAGRDKVPILEYGPYVRKVSGEKSVSEILGKLARQKKNVPF